MKSHFFFLIILIIHNTFALSIKERLKNRDCEYHLKIFTPILTLNTLKSEFLNYKIKIEESQIYRNNNIIENLQSTTHSIEKSLLLNSRHSLNSLNQIKTYSYNIENFLLFLKNINFKISKSNFKFEKEEDFSLNVYHLPCMLKLPLIKFNWLRFIRINYDIDLQFYFQTTTLNFFHLSIDNEKVNAFIKEKRNIFKKFKTFRARTLKFKLKKERE